MNKNITHEIGMELKRSVLNVIILLLVALMAWQCWHFRDTFSFALHLRLMKEKSINSSRTSGNKIYTDKCTHIGSNTTDANIVRPRSEKQQQRRHVAHNKQKQTNKKIQIHN